jgi:hypothetical protein
MPDFELKDLLQAIGPSASLIFAAWIFLSFLQSRYSSAYEHYRQLIAELRTHREQDRRLQSLCRQILAYKRRCEQMRWATNIKASGSRYRRRRRHVGYSSCQRTPANTSLASLSSGSFTRVNLNQR